MGLVRVVLTADERRHSHTAIAEPISLIHTGTKVASSHSKHTFAHHYRILVGTRNNPAHQHRGCFVTCGAVAIPLNGASHSKCSGCSRK